MYQRLRRSIMNIYPLVFSLSIDFTHLLGCFSTWMKYHIVASYLLEPGRPKQQQVMCIWLLFCWINICCRFPSIGSFLILVLFARIYVEILLWNVVKGTWAHHQKWTINTFWYRNWEGSQNLRDMCRVYQAGLLHSIETIYVCWLCLFWMPKGKNGLCVNK